MYFPALYSLRIDEQISLNCTTWTFYLFVIARCLPSVIKCGMMITQAVIADSSGSGADVTTNIGHLMALTNIAYIIGKL